MGKRKEFPNNWEELADAPAELFDTLSYDEFMEWRGDSWEIPSSVSVIMRIEYLNDEGQIHRIEERTYNHAHRATKFIKGLNDKGAKYRLLLADDEVVAVAEPVDNKDSD